jgi:type IV secretory pathway VirJ component
VNDCIRSHRSTRRPLTANAAIAAPVAVAAVAAVALLSLISGCSSLPAPEPFPTPSTPPPAEAAAIKTFTTPVVLHGVPLELHVAVADRAQAIVPDTIVLYASGDGGWFGAAVDMFKQIARAGYPVVGFSSKTFLRIQRPHHGLVNATQLAADYEAIVTQARAALHQSDSSRIVLTGWSRGAAFAVLAGSEPMVRERLAGVIAIGLGPGEDLAAVSDDEASDDGQADEVERPWRFDTYASIARLEPAACAVIQASHDNYLPAAAARRLFGPDTDRRRLYAIDARNHRFTGGKAAFDAALVDALHWIVSRPAQPASPTSPASLAAPASTPSAPSTSVKRDS